MSLVLVLVAVFDLTGGCSSVTQAPGVLAARQSSSGGSSGAGPAGGSSGGGSGADASEGPPLPPLPSSHRVDTVIDAGWKFNRGDVPGAEASAFDDGSWQSVTIPHSWNTLDGENGPTTTPAYWRGIGWYRVHRSVPADAAGMRIYLQFDGAAYIANVWVNGAAVGTHEGGYSTFRFDVTSSVHIGGDNVIAVKLDNSQAVTPLNIFISTTTSNMAPLAGDFTMFGGIQRDVHVLVTDPLAISPLDFGSPGVYLRATGVTPASAGLTTTVKLLNRSAGPKTATVAVQIFDATNSPVQTFQGTEDVPANGSADAVISGTVPNPHLWDGLADPYVYHAIVTVSDGATVTDAVLQPLGFRSYALDPNTGFSLNGHPYPIHGVCMHEDHKDIGGEFSPPAIDRDFAIIKEIGANAVRFVHYEHADYAYTKADNAGLVAWAENAFVDRIPQTCPAQCQAFQDNTQQQMTELIRQRYNHPSIFFWSVGNEVLLLPGPDPGAVVDNLVRVGEAEDSTRTIVMAASAGTENNPLDWAPQASFFNEYQGWYYDKAGDFAGWADGIHAAHPTTLVGISEYGAGANPVDHALPIVETGTDRTQTFQTEEYQAFFHETFWQAIAARPFLLGSFAWVMFDLASDYRNEGNLPGINTKGLVSYDRQTKKDAFWYYKANWSSEPFVYLASRRYTTLPQSSTTIKVYSNQPEVEVTLNGASLGTRTSANHVFLWTGVSWTAGSNAVVASAASGGVTDAVTWQN